MRELKPSWSGQQRIHVQESCSVRIVCMLTWFLGRTRIFWAIMVSIAALIFAVILFHHFKPVYVTHDPQPPLDFASRATVMDAPIPDIAKEAIIGHTPTRTEIKPLLRNTAGALDDDERLQVFDEL